MNRMKGQPTLKLFNHHPAQGQYFYYSGKDNAQLTKKMINRLQEYDQLMTKMHQNEGRIHDLKFTVHQQSKTTEMLVELLFQNQCLLCEQMERLSKKIGAISSTIMSLQKKVESYQLSLDKTEQILSQKLKKIDLGEVDYHDLKEQMQAYKVNQIIMEEQLNELKQDLKELKSIQRNQEQVQLDLYSELYLQKL